MWYHFYELATCGLTHTPFYFPFLGQPGLRGCPIASQSSVILMLILPTGHADTVRNHMVFQAVHHQLTLPTIPWDSEAEDLMGQMLFHSANNHQLASM